MPRHSDDELLAVIKKYHRKNLTVRNLCKILGYSSTATVQHRLEDLEDKGLIKRKVVRYSIIDVIEKE